MDDEAQAQEMAEDISDALNEITDDYAHLGPIFMGALFMNGIVQTICCGAKNEYAARMATETFCELIRTSVEFMIKSGVMESQKNSLQ